MNRSSGLDVRESRFPANRCMAGSVMRVPTLVLNEGEHISMFVGWEYGEYFWDAILDAGAPLGIAGTNARRRAQRGGGRVIGLLKKHRYFRSHKLRATYDAIVIGGGAHGMATAYYLAKDHGMKNVAVVEQSYIGAGASGRNTTIIRSNYLTPEGTRFYTASVKLYETLSQDLNFNMLFSQHGHLTLAHSDRSVNTMMERAEVNRLLGVDSRVIYPDEIKELEPMLDVSDHPTFPILAALYHPPGGIIRHDAVVWGYAKEADRLGVEIHPYTRVEGITRQNGRVTGIETNRGPISAGTVISCTSGWSSLVGRMAGIEVPITTHILQACVTEPVKPLLREDHRVGDAAHLHLPVRPRRVRDGLRDRAVLGLLRQGHVPVHRGSGDAHGRAPADARPCEDPAPVDRPLRRLARLRPDHGR